MRTCTLRVIPNIATMQSCITVLIIKVKLYFQYDLLAQIATWLILQLFNKVISTAEVVYSWMRSENYCQCRTDDNLKEKDLGLFSKLYLDVCLQALWNLEEFCSSGNPCGSCIKMWNVTATLTWRSSGLWVRALHLGKIHLSFIYTATENYASLFWVH